MHLLFGALTVAAGIFLLVCGTRKTEWIIYRLMVARSKVLWGEKVQRFHQVVGLMVIVFGLGMVLGYI